MTSSKHLIRSIIIIAILGILVYALVLGVMDIGKVKKLETQEVVIITSAGNVSVTAEIADDTQERMKGLMHRKKMGEDEGMLFIFPGEQPLAFWMKNTLIPLDMLFIDSEGVIVDIKQYVQPCKEDPCPSYPAKEKGKYVLEVNAGFTEEHNIDEGDKLII